MNTWSTSIYINQQIAVIMGDTAYWFSRSNNDLSRPIMGISAIARFLSFCSVACVSYLKMFLPVTGYIANWSLNLLSNFLLHICSSYFYCSAGIISFIWGDAQPHTILTAPLQISVQQNDFSKTFNLGLLVFGPKSWPFACLIIKTPVNSLKLPNFNDLSSISSWVWRSGKWRFIFIILQSNGNLVSCIKHIVLQSIWVEFKTRSLACRMTVPLKFVERIDALYYWKLNWLFHLP